MLRITVEESTGQCTLRVEGRLAGELANELTRSWDTLPRPPGVHLAVDLSGATFIDDAGARVLAALHAQGAELIATGCATRRLVASITGQKERSV